MPLNIPMPPYDPTPIVTEMGKQNALNNQNLDNQIKSVQAQYAPYTQYAQAMSQMAYANFLPYQIQAQVMSNPMLMAAYKDNPEAISKMMQNFVKSIPSASSLTGGGFNIPAPNQITGGGITGLLSHLFNRQAQPQLQPQSQPSPSQENPNMMMYQPPSPTGGPANAAPVNPLLPGLTNAVSGMIGKMTAPYSISPYKPGDLIPNPNVPGGAVSVPTPEVKTNLQNVMNAYQRVEPQLKLLADKASPFMDVKGMGKVYFEKLRNAILGGKSELPSKYADFQSLLKTIPEALLRNYGLNATDFTIHQMEGAIVPQWGETKDTYKQRVLDTLERLKQEQYTTSAKNLAQGLAISPENTRPSSPAQTNKQPQMIRMRGIDPKDKKEKEWLVPSENEAIFLKNNFKRIE